MKRAFDSATCPTCETYFDHLPVEHDDFGGYVVLEVNPCRACGLPLCPCCTQFACDGCGDAFCAAHQVLVEDGTPTPLRCCAGCATECEPLPLPFPPASETRVGIHAVEVA